MITIKQARHQNLNVKDKRHVRRDWELIFQKLLCYHIAM